MLAKGTRVQLHAATDHWMRGDRYGEIVGLGHARDYRERDTGVIHRFRPYRVRLDRSRRIVRILPDNLFPID